MPRRDNSSEGSSGRRKPSGRSGSRTNSSRSDSPRGERSSRGGDFKKPFKSSRGDSKDFSKPRRSYDRKDDENTKRPSRFSDKGDSKDFSKPRRSFDRKDDSSESRGGNFKRRSEGGYSSREEKPFRRSREDGDDVKPRRSYDRKDDSSERPSRGGNFKRRSEGGYSSREEKPFRRSREEGDESKPRRSFDRKDDSSERPSRGGNFKKRSEGFSPKEEKPFSNEDRAESKRNKFSDSDDRGDKKGGFFSKLSRGGKSFSRKAAPAPEYGPKIEKAKEDFGTSDTIRLNRYISNSGVCSRREADELIKMGLVTVNGTVVTEMGHKVSRKDVVKYDGKTLRAEKPVYIIMNKPKGFLTTTKDPQERNTVMQIIAPDVKERVYPIGRLDRNTTGLLLLTNDGELADKLMHPSYNVKKIYKVDLDKPITKADFEKIKKGVHLEEGKAIVDDLAIVSPDNKTIGIEIHIGWNRVIRRIFESLGYDVVKLDRSVYAGLDKKDLSRGHWRHLTREEVVRLKHYQ